MRANKHSLDSIFRQVHTRPVNRWKVIETESFDDWFAQIDEKAQEDIYVKVEMLAELGPSLRRPFVDTIKESRYANMKELRVQSKGRPFRIFFSFDPKRRAVLLIGGDKTGKKRFYQEMVTHADRIYKNFLKELE